MESGIFAGFCFVYEFLIEKVDDLKNNLPKSFNNAHYSYDIVKAKNLAESFEKIKYPIFVEGPRI